MGAALSASAVDLIDRVEPSVLGNLKGDSSEYWSISLSWSASSNALLYRVYLGDEVALTRPASMTRVMTGNFQRGTSEHRFKVTALGGDNNVSAKPSAVAGSTKGLPSAGKTVDTLSASQAATTATYIAEIYFPYGFVHVYVWGSETICS